MNHRSFYTLEALIKIAGVMPAFMRPRRAYFAAKLCPGDLTILSIAYGAYNDIVRTVSGIRGQTIANWNFEYVLVLV